MCSEKLRRAWLPRRSRTCTANWKSPPCSGAPARKPFRAERNPCRQRAFGRPEKRRKAASRGEACRVFASGASPGQLRVGGNDRQPVGGNAQRKRTVAGRARLLRAVAEREVKPVLAGNLRLTENSAIFLKPQTWRQMARVHRPAIGRGSVSGVQFETYTRRAATPGEGRGVAALRSNKLRAEAGSQRVPAQISSSTAENSTISAQPGSLRRGNDPSLEIEFSQRHYTHAAVPMCGLNSASDGRRLKATELLAGMAMSISKNFK